MDTSGIVMATLDSHLKKPTNAGRNIIVPEKVWDSIVSVIGSAFFEWPNDKDVIRVMQWMKEKD